MARHQPIVVGHEVDHPFVAPDERGDVSAGEVGVDAAGVEEVADPEEAGFTFQHADAVVAVARCVEDLQLPAAEVDDVSVVEPAGHLKRRHVVGLDVEALRQGLPGHPLCD